MGFSAVRFASSYSKPGPEPWASELAVSRCLGVAVSAQRFMRSMSPSTLPHCSARWSIWVEVRAWAAAMNAHSVNRCSKVGCFRLASKSRVVTNIASRVASAALKDQVAPAVRQMDRIQISLMKDLLGCLATRIGAVFVEPPDIWRLTSWCCWIAPRLEVALRDEMLLLVPGDRCTLTVATLWLFPLAVAHCGSIGPQRRNPEGCVTLRVS